MTEGLPALEALDVLPSCRNRVGTLPPTTATVLTNSSLQPLGSLKPLIGSKPLPPTALSQQLPPPLTQALHAHSLSELLASPTTAPAAHAGPSDLGSAAPPPASLQRNQAGLGVIPSEQPGTAMTTGMASAPSAGQAPANPPTMMSPSAAFPATGEAAAGMAIGSRQPAMAAASTMSAPPGAPTGPAAMSAPPATQTAPAAAQAVPAPAPSSTRMTAAAEVASAHSKPTGLRETFVPSPALSRKPSLSAGKPPAVPAPPMAQPGTQPAPLPGALLSTKQAEGVATPTLTADTLARSAPEVVNLVANGTSIASTLVPGMAAAAAAMASAATVPSGTVGSITGGHGASGGSSQAGPAAADASATVLAAALPVSGEEPGRRAASHITGAGLIGKMLGKYSKVHSTVQHSEAPGSAPVEEYIPFSYAYLRDSLLRVHSEDVFRDYETRTQFTRLCNWLSIRNTLRLTLAYDDVRDTYAHLDPDHGYEDPEDASMSGGDKVNLQAEFELGLLNILDKSEYKEITKEDFKAATQVQSAMGLCITPCNANIIDYKFWFRGQRERMIKYKSWRTLYIPRDIPSQVYKRVVLRFHLHPEQAIKNYLQVRLTAKASTAKFQMDDWVPLQGSMLLCGVVVRPVLRDGCRQSRSVEGCWASSGGAACQKPQVTLVGDSRAQPGCTYLRHFKDVEQADLDMLLPGAVAKFTWLDYLWIWVPILVGVGAAIYKAATGTLHFVGVTDIATSIVLIVMPLTWGVKAYLAVKDKMMAYQASLNELALSHNLENNSGVLGGVMGEAQEQMRHALPGTVAEAEVWPPGRAYFKAAVNLAGVLVGKGRPRPWAATLPLSLALAQEDNEVMLAYFFLWRGLKQPTSVSKLELDKAVEAYLRQLQGSDVKARLDFEVGDSIDKLEKMGILTKEVTSEGVTMLQVLPLDKALDQAHVRNFNEQREVEGARTDGPLSKAHASIVRAHAPAWSECIGVYPPTGQQFRYFWNHELKMSSYKVPTAFLPYKSKADSAASAPAVLTGPQGAGPLPSQSTQDVPARTPASLPLPSPPVHITSR
ncbi:hypothetical protein QJQ45_024861 [Haematococcus lacustris]|nr:hypothetical protein QJQ45_024861 [Haematococcus lacustris]